ncbi:hypothetical protein [Novipirellula galeiformis]|nr:hypothetical protein [Novipirellula galeiformis]
MSNLADLEYGADFENGGPSSIATQATSPDHDNPSDNPSDTPNRDVAAGTPFASSIQSSLTPDSA